MPIHDAPRRPVAPLPRTKEEWDAHLRLPHVKATREGSKAISDYFGLFMEDEEFQKRISAADSCTSARTCKYELVHAATRLHWIAGQESINAITALSIDSCLSFMVDELHLRGMDDFKYDPYEEGEY